MRSRGNPKDDDDDDDDDNVYERATTTMSNGNGNGIGIGNGGATVALPGRSRRRKRKTEPSKVRGKRGSSQKSIDWMRCLPSRISPQFAKLLLAVLLWYSLGIISISTSKILLTPSNQTWKTARYYSHVGGVTPLVLTLQQLLLGSTFLRFLLGIRFLDSKGLQPWVSLLTESSSSSSSSPATTSATPSTRHSRRSASKQQTR
jgi:hypothetical protein